MVTVSLVSILQEMLKVPSVLNLKPNHSVCWTGAEVSLLSFLTMKQRTCILPEFLGLRSSGSVFVYDLVNHYVKNRQLDGKFGDLLFAFFLEGGNRLCFVKNSQQSLSGLRPSVITDAL